jgi:hypothetical protein
LVRYRVNGFGALGISLNWEKVPGDEEVARAVISFLEDRRLLFGDRHVEDEIHCVQSANEIRRFVTSRIADAKPGRSLEASLREIRRACRQFMDRAGPNASNFRDRHFGPWTDLFSLAIGELRAIVGLHVALIATEYDLPVEPELASILPWEEDDSIEP